MLSAQISALAKSGPRAVNILRILWVATVLWFELGTFRYHVSQCKWPGVQEAASSSVSTTSEAARVLLVADPQILDHRSYPGRSSWLMTLSQFIVDLNMRRSWWATTRLSPDVVIFLGDMMDNGRIDMSEAEYESYYSRFRSVFASKDEVPMYYIPGNHDVGIGDYEAFSKNAHVRYTSHFGPLNQRVEIANHTFVMIDAPGLVEEDAKRVASGMTFERWAMRQTRGPIAFIQQSAAASAQEKKPVILISHIPLARPQTAKCGPLREKGTIREGAGFGYENTLSVHASQLLLDSIRPMVIFSGDDHDYCEYHHPLLATDDIPLSSHGTVKEISVKSFSMAMGIRRPGFQLLSLDPTLSNSAATFNDVPCALPDQIRIYLSVYVPLIIATLLVLLLANALGLRSSSSWSTSSPRLPLRTRSPTDVENLTLWGSKPSPPPTLTIKVFDASDDDADELGSGSGTYILPPPTPANFVTAKGQRRTPRVCGRTVSVRAARRLASYLLGGRGRASEAAGRRRHGVLRAFAGDVCAVAWVPIVVFVAVAWWTFL